METKDAPSLWFFRSLIAVLFLAIFYNTITNMAGIYIASDLGGGPNMSVYPMVFFGIGNVLTIPLAAPLSSRFGPLKLLVYSLCLYAFFSILCSLAPTFFLFNVYRFGLGLSSGVFYVLCRILLVSFATEKQAAAYGFWTVLVFAIVPVLGNSFGAWLAYEGVWRWIFHANLPVALGLIFYFWSYRSLDPPASSPPFDWTGYAFFFLGVGLLSTAATLAQQLDWYRSDILVFMTLVGAPCLLFFLWWSWSHPSPVLEFSLLKSPLLLFSLLHLVVLFSSYFGMIILLAIWLKIYANYTPLWISLLIGIMGVAGLIAFLLSRVFPLRVDPRVSLGLAILSFASSCYYSTYFDVETDFYHLAVARTLAGMALLLFLFPVFELTMASYDKSKGVALFSLFQFFRALASALGSALYVILWQRRQAFFHERLGEGLTVYSTLTKEYFQRATEVFGLSEAQATAELGVLLDTHATSLALNDTFGCMGYILLGLLLLLLLSFFTPWFPKQS